MEQAGPRRRPPEGGYARGDEKRALIIEAALRAFGQHGYERASTRQIAQDARVNPPALQYYFESKQGLYAACSDYMLDRMSQAMEGAYGVAELAVTAPAAVDALCAILDALADFMFGSPLMEDWSRFVAREQSEGHSPVWGTAKQQLSARLHGVCARLVGLATGRPAADIDVKLQTIAIMGQLTTFYLSRGGALAHLGWPNIEDDRLAQLKRIVRLQTRAILASGVGRMGGQSCHTGSVKD